MKSVVSLIRPRALTALVLASFMPSLLAQEISIPDPGLNAAIREVLLKPSEPLTQQDMLSLTNLVAASRNINSLEGLESAHNLTGLDLQSNHLAHLPFPSGLTKLKFIDLSFNPLTNCLLPNELTNLSRLIIKSSQLTNLTLPSDLSVLIELGLQSNQFTRFDLPSNLTGLGVLDLSANHLTRFTLPPSLTELADLNLENNQLTSFTLPSNLTNLFYLNLGSNSLTICTLPNGLTHLDTLEIGDNQLTGLTLPAGLTRLLELDLKNNQLTNITLPASLTNLALLTLNGNPIATVVLSEPLAAANLAETVASLQSQGVSVFTYPLTVRLIRLRQPIGAFQFAIIGPPGVYGIHGSPNLAIWSELRPVTNALGSIAFTDGEAHLSPQKFYRVLSQSPPANMVFIPPNTFTMGSPASELHRNTNEGPQTTVTLSRGFWIGKYEVTQGEYLSVMNTDPSFFPGDLSRPVSSVSWPAATNYCWNLTLRERAAGRISSDSQYRLPTEAEWECAARAGTSTRFSYGDDPGYTSLANHAWYFLNGDLTVHSVGQKLPNPWGLYDIEGNVWEWCQDWLGDLPGGAVIDPQGPPSNPIGLKVIRGGGYDFGEPDCRSARRYFFGNHPALNDSDLGFRVVLVTGPQ